MEFIRIGKDDYGVRILAKNEKYALMVPEMSLERSRSQASCADAESEPPSASLLLGQAGSIESLLVF